MASNLIKKCKSYIKTLQYTVNHWVDIQYNSFALVEQARPLQTICSKWSKLDIRKEQIKWYYNPIKQNSTDIGVCYIRFQTSGEKVLHRQQKIKEWPDQPILSESKESKKVAKLTKNILATTVKKNDLFDFLLDEYELRKVLRVSHQITRFINNCQKVKKRGLLTTSEIQCQEKFNIKCEQRNVEYSHKLEESRKRQNTGCLPNIRAIKFNIK